MKTQPKILLCWAVLALIVLGSCQSFEPAPITKSDQVPKKVTVVGIERLPGGATIDYAIPKGGDILYVMAESTVRSDFTIQEKASYYHHKITLYGFPDTSEYTIELFSVSRSEVRSEPVRVAVSPLEPPIFTVAETMEINSTYGGISVSFKNNHSNASLTVGVATEKANGELSVVKNFYTDANEDTLYLRGFDAVTRKFGVFIKDEWGNSSDTVMNEFTPLFETQLDKTKFINMRLPGDSWQEYKSWGPASATWDGSVGGGKSMFGGQLVGVPQWFSIDIGGVAKVSRLLYYPEPTGNYAYGLVPKHFQVWGSNDPDPDGGWDNWVLLSDCHVAKPSGSPQGVITGEDIEYAQKGIEFVFPTNTPPVRYIRFKTLSIWNGESVLIRELTFYGNPNP